MDTVNRQKQLKALLDLSHELGRDDRTLAILGEGNTSARLSDKTFLVKASGSNLGTLGKQDVVECRTHTLLSLLDCDKLSDAEINGALMQSRLNVKAKKPSVEALFHAYFLTLDGVEFVGHTHAQHVNSLLCSPRAREFAAKRLFPDEVVYCGVESVFVPYTDPGLPLAQIIRQKTDAFIRRHARTPRVVLIENHGIITLGGTVEAVLSAMLMAEKAAAIWLGAAALGGPTFMTSQHVARIAGRPDEEVRRRALKIH